MNKQQAEKKSRAHSARWKEGVHYHRVAFRRCAHCDEAQVFRANEGHAAWLGWEWYCWVCSAKDADVVGEANTHDCPCGMPGVKKVYGVWVCEEHADWLREEVRRRREEK